MNHHTPKLTLKQRLQHIRYAKLEKELKPLCKWVDFYDYIWSYGSIDWKKKIVLDIGADIGSSALFFLMNGAGQVLMVENNPMYNTEYSKLKRERIMGGLLDKSLLIDPIMLQLRYFDVLKMDCEGCELWLLTEELLNKSKEFVIGLHKPQLNDYQFEQKKRLLEKHGGKYFGNVNKEEFVWQKVVK
jgi:hypothetical protein